MAGAVQVGALVINMQADIATLKTNLSEATRAAQTASQKMSADLTAGLRSIESALAPLQSLTVKFGSLESQMNNAKSSAMSLAKGLIIGSAAGMSIDAIKNKILGVIEGMAHLKEVSEKTGSSVESLSKLSFVAKQSGTDIDSIAAALAKMSKGMAGADNETKGAGLALAYLGIKAKDAAGNLKDPADMFGEVAKKLADYRDGAGKAAISMALFGKTGADMLPTLKLLGEQGDIQVKVTDAQATAARQYERDLAKLNAQKGMLFKTIATELLPAMSDFANVMLDASKNTNVVNGAVKGLAQDKSLSNWADDVAMGLAFVIDTVKVMPSIFATATAGFGSLASLAKLTLVSMPGAAFVTEKDAQEKAYEELGQAQLKYGEQIAKLLTSEVDATRKAMQAKIDARKAAAAQQAAAEQPLKALNFNTAGEDGADEAKRNVELDKRAKLLAELSGVTGSYIEDLSRLQVLRVQMNMSDERYVALVTQLIDKQPGARKMIEEQARAIEESNKRAAQGAIESAKAWKVWSDAQAKAIADATSEADKNEQLAATFGMTKAAIEAQTVARLEEQLAQRAATGMTLDEIDSLEKLIEAKKRNSVALATLDGLEAQKKMWDSIEQTAHDTFISIFDSGKSAFNRLRDALKNGLLDLLYQMTLKKWILNIGASVGLGGAGGLAQAASGTNGTGLIGAAQSASSLYSAFSNGLNGGIGNAITAAGNMFGSAAVSSFGSGLANGTATAEAASAYAAAGNTTVAAGLNAGASVAQYIPTIAVAVASYFGARAIAGQYRIEGIGTALNYLGLGGGLLNRAFGMGDKETTASGIRGTLSADSLTGTNYTDWLQKGGWFRSDRHGTDTTALSTGMVAQFTQGLSAMETASAGFAKALGVNGDAISGYSKAFDLKLTGDAAKDQQVITEFFSGIGDELANKLVPSLADFSKTGETASATLQRLAGDFQATTQVAQLIGKTAAQVFGDVGLASGHARERLIELAGGASVLNQQAAGYAQNFLTEAQRLVPVQKALDAAMASLGLSSVQTRDQFKSCIDSLDLTTEAGAKQFTSMMALADAFAQVHPVIDATAIAAAEAAAALKASADAMQAIKDNASSLLSGVDGAFSALQSVVSREKAALQDKIATETALVAKYTALSGALHSALDGMGRTPDQAVYDRMAAQAQVKTALAIAKAGGGLPLADSLKTALSTLGKDASGQFASYQDYLADFYRTQNDIAALAGLSDSSLSVEQKSLDALNDQSKYLDDVVSKAQEQINVLKGQSTALLSLNQAIQALGTAILSAQANPVVAAGQAVNDTYQKTLGRAPDQAGMAYWQQQAAAGVSVGDITSAIAGSPEATIQGMYKTIFGRPADSAGMAFWLGQVAKGTSLADIGAAIAGSGETKLHSFDVGSNAIPFDMVAKVHKDERIIPAADNRALMARLSQPSESNAALVAEVRALRAEVAALRKDNSAENYAIAKHSMKIADSLDGAVNGTRPIITAPA